MAKRLTVKNSAILAEIQAWKPKHFTMYCQIANESGLREAVDTFVLLNITPRNRTALAINICLYEGIDFLTGSDLDYDWHEDHNVYPREGVYTYGMINRPAIEAAPKGWFNPDHNAIPFFPVTYGTVDYNRKLTEAELHAYEMVPVSANAHRFQIGDQVVAHEMDDCTVTAQRGNRYTCKYDFDGECREVHREDLTPLQSEVAHV